ncbi:MAG: TetR/AcrR family transcriptional regulator [Clostridiales bacterium]|jgi:AcrR family transcriptional regulator|nr:TetR/AcrR family transcriptional regulator [Clostridiales bacterium]
MPKKGYEALSNTRREEIEEKAMRLYLDNKYEDITLKMLLDALSLHPTTFYRYFYDKDELYLHLIEITLRKLDKYFQENSEGGYDLMTQFSGPCSLSDLEVDFSKTLLDAPSYILLRSYYEVYKDTLFDRYKEILGKLRLEGKLRPDVDEDLTSYMYATSMFNLLMFYKDHGIKDTETLKKMKKYLFFSFFPYGLMNEKPADETN